MYIVNTGEDLLKLVLRESGVYSNQLASYFSFFI